MKKNHLENHLVAIKMIKALDGSAEMIKSKVKVALIDSGVNLNSGEIIKSISFLIDQHYDKDEKSEHGTYIKDILLATNPYIEIVSLKVVDNNKQIAISPLIEAIEYCIKEDIKIINYSNAIKEDYQELKKVIEKYPGLLICSSGNDGINLNDFPVYPACYNLNNILTVGSCNFEGKESKFSNYGRAVDILAPGENYQIEKLGVATKMLNGTSIATALVSAIAALILAIKPELDSSQIKSLIINSTKEQEQILGMVNGLNIVRELKKHSIK